MQQLIEACKSNNVFAQRRLYDQYVKRMFRVCLRYIANEADAEEVLMDGFLKVFMNIPHFEYKDEIGFNAWIKRIMVNESLQFLRRKRIFQISIDDPTLDLADTSTDPITDCDTELLYELLLRLPVGYRTVFNLYVIEGYKHDEIAKELKISEGTSKSQLSKARAMIQKKWKENEKYGT